MKAITYDNYRSVGLILFHVFIYVIFRSD